MSIYRKPFLVKFYVRNFFKTSYMYVPGKKWTKPKEKRIYSYYKNGSYTFVR